MRSGKTNRPSSLRAIRLCSLMLVLSVPTFSTVVQAVEVGDKAPDFSLPSTKGDPVSLSQFLSKKNVVLEFYVLDFTPT